MVTRWVLALVIPLFMMGNGLRLQTPLRSISGRVTDAAGTPLTLVFMLLLSPEDHSPVVDPVQTDQYGYYQIQAPAGQDLILLALPFSGQTADGYQLRGYVVQSVWLAAGFQNILRDFSLRPCHDLILEGYSPDGSLVIENELAGHRFTEDTAGNATEYFLGIAKEGMPTVPATCIPLDKPRRLFIQWTVPEFGNVVLAADNGGVGYSANEQGGTVLNLNYELARSQVDRLQANVERYQEDGYAIPPDILTDLGEAEALLVQASNLLGDEQAALSDQIMGLALWALEDLEQARAEQDIPRYRMGSCTLLVVDGQGAPLSEATISYQQTSHDFLFGAFDTLAHAGVEIYELMQAAGINYLTSGFYWAETEPAQDLFQWEHIDHEIGVPDLSQMGFVLKAHALMAFWDFATPEYLLEMSFGELDAEVHEHISMLVDRYRQQIGIWNVINEAHSRGAALDLSRTEITTLTQTGIRAIRDHAPEARIIVNNAFEWYGESRIFWPLVKGKPDDFTLSIPAYLDHLAANNLDYEIIGQQLYNGGYTDFFAQFGLGEPSGVATWDLAHISAILDRLGEYGKPLHVTEQSVPSSWDPEWIQYGAGWWHHPWDEETQAEFVHDFYTLVFGKEQAEAITWWNINDDGSFIFTGGLLNANNEPKPAYYALKDLIDGWTTAGQGHTDTTGEINIQGYGGQYTLTILHGGRVWQRTMHIQEQQDGECVILLGDSWVFLPLVFRER